MGSPYRIGSSRLFDDIRIYSPIDEEYLDHFRYVLKDIFVWQGRRSYPLCHRETPSRSSRALAPPSTRPASWRPSRVPPSISSTKPSPSASKLIEQNATGPSSSLDHCDPRIQFEWKSKLYKDASLSQIFLMNHVHYIVEKAKGSPELREMIGNDYLRKLTGKFKEAAMSYQRTIWVSILYYLRDEGLHISGSFPWGFPRQL
ncbi:hypothetical protein NE237_016500 [Protea cynaroides]|uniref:Exocyst subunit Exo70 family protein n=1 Tax=Protea cynaroides TaxID=273540 RepID=A0A9Q0K693_9MAGN|nr:hypothetical protein NE237_016500 [Protea cynaroides]